ncbi:hypothetical protein POTOM_045735 [Populus tomentosa]|uniref:RING-CH-type domain-containing protein n=1 Tax=Populus tomentosa TaxID=118781 RepID=A0A8X7YIB5_POPTO|nr:hypothetical protein POTOM_045735 [Populus tomentosa]
MVDDFMVCVDRIIVASTCFESVHNGERDRNRSDGVGIGIGIGATGKDGNVSESVVSVKGNEEGSSCSLKKVEMVECRICQEEAEVLAMEAPCACNGTLKISDIEGWFWVGRVFAHRKCIQRWCNKKGDITCEICNQVFSPNYSLPPARINPDVMAIDIRQAWGHHIDLHDSHLLALEHQLLQSEYEDYAVANTSSIACLRSVALILLIILLLRQALMVTRDSGMVQESSTFFSFQVSLLQFAGFLLPCYVMARSWYIVQSRRRRHVYLLIIHSAGVKRDIIDVSSIHSEIEAVFLFLLLLASDRQAPLSIAICQVVSQVTAIKWVENQLEKHFKY